MNYLSGQIVKKFVAKKSKEITSIFFIRYKSQTMPKIVQSIKTQSIKPNVNLSNISRTRPPGILKNNIITNIIGDSGRRKQKDLPKRSRGMSNISKNIDRRVKFNQVVHTFKFGDNWRATTFMEKLKTEAEQQVNVRYYQPMYKSTWRDSSRNKHATVEKLESLDKTSHAFQNFSERARISSNENNVRRKEDKWQNNNMHSWKENQKQNVKHVKYVPRGEEKHYL